ncbi:MAG: YihY family inner membrane protein [Spirochaetes bacterium]|nr:YihY family inner membrane protein [Spirochaetota bacterium]
MRAFLRALLSRGRRFASLAWLFYRLTLRSEIPIRSASLSFSTILSVVPIITIIFGVFANFQAFSAMQKQLEDALLGVILPQASTVLRDVFRQFTNNSGKLTAIGLLSLFVTTASVFLDLNNMVNRIWEVRVRRNLFQNLTIFWLALTLGPFLLGLSFALSGEVGRLLGQFLPTGWYFARTGKALSWVLGFLVFFLMFTVLPNTHVSKRHSALAAIVTSVGLEALRMLFAFWYGRFTSYNAIYGSLSAVPLFFLWMYLNWYVVLLGVQLNRFLAHVRDPDEELRNSRNAVPELAILLALGEGAYQHHGGITEPELAALVPVTGDRFQAGLDWLVEKRWIAKGNERWVLTAAPETILVRDLFAIQLPALPSGRGGDVLASKIAARLSRVETIAHRALAKRTLRDLLKAN